MTIEETTLRLRTAQRKIAVYGSLTDHWIPLSDLMTGLMMMFMLIAIMFMVKIEADTKKIKNVAVVYDKIKTQLYLELQREFEGDLARWGAELDRDLTMRFKEPDVLFGTGEDSLKPRFVAILDEFFPRYIRILSSDKYRASIEEIRVEGHTSSVWSGTHDRDEAYFLNMALSQSRTRSVLQHVLMLSSVRVQEDWLRERLTANGLSSSKLVRRPDGSEDPFGSQRVEFRVRTNADERIDEILKAAQQ